MTPLADIPADPNVEPSRYSRFWFRFFEILPGAAVWTAIILPFILAVYYPLSVTVFILLFDIYWFLRAISYAITLTKGYFKFRKNTRADWNAKLAQLSALTDEERSKWQIAKWEDVYHAVIVPTYKEGLDILERSLDSVVNASFNKDRIIVVVATEERAGAHAKEIAVALTKRYQGVFHGFMVSEHPDNIVGEVKAKGANATWAAKLLKTYLEEHDILFENVIVSIADSDTRFPAYYFSCLAYNYCVTPDRVHAGFQPIPTFFNNIWQAPMISRILAFNTTFWSLGESIRDYRLLTYSTHATSFQTLVDINYWCTSVVNEDSRQFFRSFFRYRGKFRVVPLFIPIYMDAVYVEKAPATLRNLYYQQQRWAYGVEHFPYIVLESHRQRRSISLGKRIMLIWRAFDGAFSWATTSFFITIVGWLPFLLNAQFHTHVVASNFPQVTKLLLSLTWVGLVISSAITILILPNRPKTHSPLRWISMIIQWALIPVVAIFFGAVPGLDAQTRLMLGKYIGFRVTEKKAV